MNKVFIKNIEVPSVNHYLGRTKYGRVYTTPKAREFKKLMQIYCKDFEMFSGSVGVIFKWYINHNRRSDLDNRLKVLLDSLTGIAYEDDKQVVSINAEKIKTDFNGIELEIYGKDL